MNVILTLMRKMAHALWAELPLFCLLYLFFTLPIFFEGRLCYNYIGFMTLVAPQPFVYVLLLCLAAHSRRWIWWTTVTITSLLFFAELLCFFCQDTRITSAILIIILQSNINEAHEFLLGTTAPVSILKASCITILIIIGTAYIDNRWKRHYMATRIDNFIRQRKHRPAITASILVLALLISARDNITVINNHLHEYWQRLSYMSKACTPIAYYYAVYDTLNQASQTDLDILESTIDDIDITSAQSDSLSIIYVIGESHIKYRSNIYGYFLPTNPNMSRYAADSSLIAYDNVITFNNRTKDVFRQLLSMQHIGDGTNFHDQPLLPAIMKKAGYHVTFYSNQSLIATTDHFDFGCYYFLCRKSIADKCFDTTNDTIFKYDGELVDNFPPTYTAAKNFTIYHLMGQHVYAQGRYPDKFGAFSPDDYKQLDVYDEAQRQDMAVYDNASLYNDLVLDKIIRSASDRNAVVIYVPDHGDEQHDYRRQSGRILNCYLPGTIKTVYELPLFIWMSDRFRQQHPETVSKLRQHTGKPIYNSDIPHTILDIAGISTTSFRPIYSLLSDSTSTVHRHIGVQQTYDYDANRRSIHQTELYYDNMPPAKQIPDATQR